MIALTRRAFLCVIAGGALQFGFFRCADGGGESQAVVELRTLFRNPAGLEVVGSEAIKALPPGVDADALLKIVAPERGISQLRNEILQQYGLGETLDVGGWPIAVTEMRVFVLLYILRKPVSG